MDFFKQMDGDFYKFENYVDNSRWNTYWYQIKETLDSKPQSVLVIGVGDGIVPDLLRKMKLNVKTLDIDPAMAPDFLGSVAEVARLLRGESFDAVICCQVLEHLPFEEFEPILAQLATCTRRRLVLGLPYRFKKRMRIGKLVITIPELGKVATEVGHYWEIAAAKTTSKAAIAEAIDRHFRIERTFMTPHNARHLFYILGPIIIG